MTPTPGGPGHQLSPERVFALVVGIESYRVGADWNLRGPARDAVRFAEWLTGGAGVPESNVRLFLSPLPAVQGHPPADPLPDHRPATKAEIEDALLRELPKCDGDLLVLYWAGHGYSDDDDRLLLPFADAGTESVRHLDLDSALRFWRSTSITRGRFARVVSIGDACRLDIPARVRSTFGSTRYGSGGRAPGRSTFVLYAAQPGRPAQNLDGAGRLTDTLLARLDGRSFAESIDRLPDIARQVRDDLAELADQGLAWQQIQWRITGWDGSPLTDDGWPDEPPGAPPLDAQAWAELTRLFTGPRLPPDAYHAYRWAFEAAGCAPPGPVLPAAEPMAVVRDLDKRLGGGGRRLPLPLAFVRYLAAREDDPERAERLADWVRRTGRRLGADAVPAPPAPEREGRAELHVQLAESSDEDGYLVRMWRYRRGFEALWESARPVDLTTVQGELVHQLFGPAADPDVQRIEFHVPEILLDEPFESWPLPTRRRRTAELGRAYEVLVRCPDERTHQSEKRWKSKWAWYREHGGRHPDAVVPLSEGTPLDLGLADRLGAEGHPVCALLDRHGAPLSDRLEVLLDAGMPIAVWRRTPTGTDTDPRTRTDPGTRTTPGTDRDRAEGPDGCGGCRARTADGLAAVLAAAGSTGSTGSTTPTGSADPTGEFDLGRLPALVRQVRIGGPPGGCGGCPAGRPGGEPLGLLWDDPEHRPQTRSLS
ncbi:caspase family protein [Kitasatospora sp. NPDC048239]|uniref:VMAP-C domain-containing protein n=1 Tax=Kitasatospora sp. NPDC048239 TaxID=3364046 RepID=UPI003714A2C0